MISAFSCSIFSWLWEPLASRLFLFPEVCPPALSLNPLLFFCLPVVAEVTQLLVGLILCPFQKLSGKVEGSWERWSLLLSSLVCLEHPKISSLYVTWREDLPLSYMMRSIFKLNLCHWDGGKAPVLRWESSRAHSHWNRLFLLLTLLFQKPFFRPHKNHFHRFSTNLFVWLRMWHHMLPISKSQLAVKYGNMPLTTPQRNQPSHTKRPIMCQLRLFKPWNYSVLKYIALVFNVTLERHSL